MLETELDQSNRIDLERNFHNARYGSGEDSRGHLNKYYVAIADADRQYNQLVKSMSAGKTILEYGCADGTAAILEMQIPEAASEYHGIDISDASIALAEGKAGSAGYKNCRFQVMNAEEMTFGDNSFDLIYGHGILHHLDLAKCFAELRRTLKPGGTAIFMEPLGHNPLLNWYRNRTPALRTPDEHPLLASDLTLAKNYFEHVDLKFAGLTTMLALPFQKTRLARASLATFIAVDRLLFLNRSLGLQAWYALLILTKTNKAVS